MNGPFMVRKHDEGEGIVRLAVHGDVDNDSSDALSVIIKNAADQAGIHALVVDLDRVPYLAAAGIRSLLEGRQSALVRGCSYYVINARDIVADALVAAGVAAVLSSPAMELRPHPATRRSALKSP
ncbi:STAS domain-containing protein [Actinoplanes sp. NPDC023714]|uniref:STAS domain-containing protein n=1 Tax=Actinoplanes sp. NPDC023714 TaxID=3154322 RepID=UPI0033D550D0